MVLKAKADAEARGVQVRRGPSAATWSPEVDMLAHVVDRLGALAAGMSGSQKAPPLYPRPRNAFERAEYRRRQKAHESLVARVLGPRP
jgi:hypothetical protein